MNKPLTLFVVVSLILAACSSNTTNPTSTVTVVQPKAGSTFTHEEFSTDTATGNPISESKATYTYTFVQTGISHLGRTNVSEITYASDSTTSTEYFNYESSGDVSLLFTDNDSTGKWVLLPITSKTTTTVTISDTTIDFFGVPMRVKLTLTTSYVGTENFTVKGQSISTVKVKSAVLTSITVAGSTNDATNETILLFAPSLGFLVKMETQVNVDPISGSKSEGNLSTLVDYNLIK